MSEANRLTIDEERDAATAPDRAKMVSADSRLLERLHHTVALLVCDLNTVSTVGDSQRVRDHAAVCALTARSLRESLKLALAAAKIAALEPR